MTNAGDSYRAIRLFIIFDRLGAAAGIAAIAVVNGLFLHEPWIWLIALALVLLIGALTLAQKKLRQGSVGVALAWIAVPNSLVALLVPIFLPFLWPVMILTVLMGLVLSAPHLSRSQLLPAIMGAGVAAATVAALGLLNDDGGVIEDIEDEFELVLVIGALVAQVAPIGLVAWQHNQLQRENVERLSRLNEDLVASQHDLAESRRRVVDAADGARRRIERDLHDGAQQRLVALGVRLRLLESQGHDDPEVTSGIEALISELDVAIEEVRELAHGIYPPLLQTRGLAAALGAVTRRSPLDINVDAGEIERLAESTETALYFTALEALTNAAKHAPDSSVELTLRRLDGHVLLTVSDDGPGFIPAETTTSHGTRNMSDRLAVVGGSLDIASQPGRGTTVTASAPIDARPE